MRSRQEQGAALAGLTDRHIGNPERFVMIQPQALHVGSEDFFSEPSSTIPLDKKNL
jgi:hypothetical protein